MLVGIASLFVSKSRNKIPNNSIAPLLKFRKFDMIRRKNMQDNNQKMQINDVNITLHELFPTRT